MTINIPTEHYDKFPVDNCKTSVDHFKDDDEGFIAIVTTEQNRPMSTVETTLVYSYKQKKFIHGSFVGYGTWEELDEDQLAEELELYLNQEINIFNYKYECD